VWEVEVVVEEEVADCLVVLVQSVEGVLAAMHLRRMLGMLGCF
jgi:hypothetical protein